MVDHTQCRDDDSMKYAGLSYQADFGRSRARSTMTRLTKATVIILIAYGLSACQQTGPSAPLQGAQPNSSAPQARTSQSTGAVSPAESACLAAVASKVGKGGVSTISVNPSQENTSVMVRVPGAQAPWSCTYQGGKVVEVFFAGSEGKL